jgi:hypothetical protein
MKLLVESLVIVGLTFGAAALVAQGKPAFADVAVAHAATAAPCVANLWADDTCEAAVKAEQAALFWNSP